ncbi:hypothetical protein Zmor_005978 [Zophobas morio]|uniref:Uncharacterized protein n=1 Tax=Zophobas morio TaxID=2755281 RepID=A0AA38IWP3_9CUCU|nr:hypothetical protein Zmor_005978 [Zophobas morio]
MRPDACCPQVFGWRRYLHSKLSYSTITWRLQQWITTPTLRIREAPGDVKRCQRWVTTQTLFSGGGAGRIPIYLHSTSMLLILSIQLIVYISVNNGAICLKLGMGAPCGAPYLLIYTSSPLFTFHIPQLLCPFELLFKYSPTIYSAVALKTRPLSSTARTIVRDTTG